MITVTLTPTEQSMAERIGRQRHELRMQRGAETHGNAKLAQKLNRRSEHNEMGAVAEYALAKHYGDGILQDWLENRAFVEDHKKIVCDLGSLVQVRATDKAHGGLVVQSYDEARFSYVLGITNRVNRTVTFVGWQSGSAVMRERYWMGAWPKPAYLYPQSDLLDMDLLPPEDLLC